MNTKFAFEGKKYRVNGIEMNVVITGQGPDVLLVHGFPDSIAVWRHQIPVLVEAGYRVIAPDQRGFGESEAPRETKAYAIENYVADLVALLDTLGIAKVRLVGHDWAAAVCWQFCMKHPERVDRYVDGALQVHSPGDRPGAGVGRHGDTGPVLGGRRWFCRHFPAGRLGTRCPAKPAAVHTHGAESMTGMLMQHEWKGESLMSIPTGNSAQGHLTLTFTPICPRRIAMKSRNRHQRVI